MKLLKILNDNIKTPFRISLIGGGTDFPDYYKYYKGLVVGGTIDKYCYVQDFYLQYLIINIE